MSESSAADEYTMLWPVAALAVFIVCFAVVYGSVVQSRLDAYLDGRDSSRARPKSSS